MAINWLCCMPLRAVSCDRLRARRKGSDVAFRMAEKDNPMGWCFFKHPGGLNEHAENRAHLPGQSYERQVAGKDQNWVKVCVHGEYGSVRDGKPVYPQCAVLRKAMAGGQTLKRVQVSGTAKYRDMPGKNNYLHVAESLQYLLVGGGEARLLVKRENRGPRPAMAVME